MFELEADGDVERWVLRQEVAEWVRTWLDVKERELHSYRVMVRENLGDRICGGDGPGEDGPRHTDKVRLDRPAVFS